MQIRHLTPAVAVSEQINPGDVPSIAAAGFRLIINNRPDHEVPGQPTSAEIEAAAAEVGLAYVFVPAVSGSIDEAAVDQMARALSSSAGPVLAFCRSGTRSATLWALSQAGKVPADQLIGDAAAAGYDLRGLATLLR